MIPEDLLYTENHHWLRIMEDGVAGVGLTDFAQDKLGEIVYVELPKVGTHIVAGEEFGSLESVKASIELYSPLTGVIEEVNKNLQENPDLINQSPYDEGWIIRIKMEDNSETHGLMDGEAYEFHTKRNQNEGDAEELEVDEEETEEEE